jgi:hypothetical protein
MPSTCVAREIQMPESSKSTPAATAARREIVASLKDDHKHALRAFREFEKLVPEGGHDSMRALVTRTLALLELHAALEAEVFYPAVRALPRQADKIEEAEVEHASMKSLMDLLKMRTTGPADPKYIARFRVLGEYVRHHVHEEEDVLIPGLEREPLAWEELAARLRARRDELARAHPLALEATGSAAPADGPAPRAGRGAKSGAARKTAVSKEGAPRSTRATRSEGAS